MTSTPRVGTDANRDPSDGRQPVTTDLVTLGEAMVLLLAGSAMPLRTATSYSRSVAGAESTVAIGAARLGLRTAWISRVGADPFGEVVKRAMRAEGVAVHVTVDPTRPTGMLVRDMPLHGGIRVQYYRTGSAASALSPADVDGRLVSRARLVHVTGITAMLSDSAAAAVDAALLQARSAGRVVSFDPNVRHSLGDAREWAERAGPLAAASDIVLSGVDELRAVSGFSDEVQAVQALLAAGVGVVVVKDGIHGSRGYTGAGSVSADGQRVPAVDAVGAGDAFAAGFLSRLLVDHPTISGGQVPGLELVHRALLTGNAVAASAISVAGDTEGLPFGFPSVLGVLDAGHVQR